MLKVKGAFLPAERSSSSFGGCHHAVISPPKRFVATQFSGGLKFFFQQLRNKKNDLCHDHEPGSQTSEDGRFQPSYPVPLLGKRYKFVQVIGRGQSSILISAEDCFHPDKKTVALKVMHLDYSRLGVQEVECIQQLNKVDGLRVSRIVQLLNKFTFDGHYCIVFELLRPRPLHQYFQRCQFDNEEAKLKVIRKLALQLLQALAFLKRENVIHADLKPENILLEEGEEIKVKVVDFGNAIRCIHREVSLYYDEFELQTLLYRAPEVMFGVPFGPEIDIWSLGCILAELYIGAPLFIGRNKKELLKELVSVLGPVPRNPFQSGKFFHEFCEFAGQFAEDKPLLVESNLMRKLHNTRNFLFASFLAGLLQYKPHERLTPWRAFLHTFLAPEVPNAYLLPPQGEKSPGTNSPAQWSQFVTDTSRCYTNIFITPQQYQVKPHIDSGITRQHFSSRELLHRGTSESSNRDIMVASGSPVIRKVSSLAPRQIRHDDSPFVRLSCDASTANTVHSKPASVKRQKPSDTHPVVNSRYAREGPLTTSKTVSPHLDRKNRFGDIYDTKEEQSDFHRNLVEQTKVASSTHINPFTCPKKEEHSDFKFNSSNKRLLEGKSRVEEAVSGFSVETPNIGEVKMTNQTQTSKEMNENCYMKDRLSKDKTAIGAARTRVYFAKLSKSQKLETLHTHSQSSLEDLKNRFDRFEESRPIGLSWTTKSTKHKMKEIKLHSVVQEQDSNKQTNAISSTYHEDVVMLL